MPSAAANRARALLAAAAPRHLTLPGRGVQIALLEWGGDGPLALLHHANGFCKGVWGLVADGLRERYRVVALDARGHGDSTHPEEPHAYGWDHFAEDLVAVAEQLGGGQPIALGLGHSFGGTAMIGAAARRPELFAQLLLVDPVIPPPHDPARPYDRQPYVHKLVEGARRRRAHWPSLPAARDYCLARPFFAGWRPEALELYLLDGLHRRADGSLELKCPGAIEAAIFAGSAHVDISVRARQVRCPTLIQWASGGDFPRPVHEHIAAAMVDGRVETADCGHLVPMERPELVIDAALRLL